MIWVILLLYIHIGLLTYLTAQIIECSQCGYYRIDKDNLKIIPLTVFFWPIVWFTVSVIVFVRMFKWRR